jgi:hypothetical protein
MALELESILVGAAAALGGAVAGAIISSWATLKSTQLSLEAEHGRTLLELRHDRLMEILDNCARVFFAPATLHVSKWNAEERGRLLAMFDRLYDHSGLASFYPNIASKLTTFRGGVAERIGPLISALDEHDEKALEKVKDDWNILMAPRIDALSRATREALNIPD